MRGMTPVDADKFRTQVISIHIPHARDDGGEAWAIYAPEISIHIPHARDDRRTGLRWRRRTDFNPHPSCEG